MKKLGHLESYKVSIKTLSPVFIGSGNKLNKKEYIFIPDEHSIAFVRLEQLASYLNQKRLLPQFEKFMLGQAGNMGLYEWLQMQEILKNQYNKFLDYIIEAGDAVGNGGPRREIYTFVKDSQGKAYIPGSSIKGALRTALAAKLIMDDRTKFSRYLRDIEMQAEQQSGGKSYLRHQSENLENALFKVLGLSDKYNNAVNDVMRGVQVSDSMPIKPENLILTVKIDRRTDGNSNIINRGQDSGLLFRECLRPGAEIFNSLTLDKDVLKNTGISIEFIKSALDDFEENYYENFASYFNEILEDAECKCVRGVPLLIGGGIGFVSKTLIYPLTENREKGLKTVSQILSKQFPMHKHFNDIKTGVSPHLIKYTKVNKMYYPLGYCEVCIE